MDLLRQGLTPSTNLSLQKNRSLKNTASNRIISLKKIKITSVTTNLLSNKHSLIPKFTQNSQMKILPKDPKKSLIKKSFQKTFHKHFNAVKAFKMNEIQKKRMMLH